MAHQACWPASRPRSSVSVQSRVRGWSSLPRASASTSPWWTSPRTTGLRHWSPNGRVATCHRAGVQAGRDDVHMTTSERTTATNTQPLAKNLTPRSWWFALIIDGARVSFTRLSLTNSKCPSATLRQRQLVPTTTTVISTLPSNTKVVHNDNIIMMIIGCIREIIKELLSFSLCITNVHRGKL